MYKGILVAMVTPFKEGELDIDALRVMTERLIASGVHGLVPLGTTGEGATLDLDERQRALKAVVDVAKGRVPIIAGTGTSSTKTTIALSQQARSCGADACLVVTPPYNKPSKSGLSAHFKTVAGNAGLPIILYNVPSRTGVSIDTDTVADLAEDDNIVAIKEASADMALGAELVRACRGNKFSILSGDDASALPLWSVGGLGVISVTANLVPETFVRMWNAFVRHDIPEAQRIHHSMLPLYRALFIETNPVPVKVALATKGLCREEVRSPLAPLTTQSRLILEKVLLTWESNNIRA